MHDDYDEEDNIFLSSGTDNLALRRAAETSDGRDRRLDHIGFILDRVEDVDRWHQYRDWALPGEEERSEHRRPSRAVRGHP
jgi:hypothetical protein